MFNRIVGFLVRFVWSRPYLRDEVKSKLENQIKFDHDFKKLEEIIKECEELEQDSTANVQEPSVLDMILEIRDHLEEATRTMEDLKEIFLKEILEREKNHT